MENFRRDFCLHSTHKMRVCVSMILIFCVKRNKMLNAVRHLSIENNSLADAMPILI